MPSNGSEEFQSSLGYTPGDKTLMPSTQVYGLGLHQPEIIDKKDQVY